MHDIHIPSFIFGAFCMTCLIISYYFGKWAVGDGECGEFEEVNEE